MSHHHQRAQPQKQRTGGSSLSATSRRHDSRGPESTPNSDDVLLFLPPPPTTSPSVASPLSGSTPSEPLYFLDAPSSSTRTSSVASGSQPRLVTKQGLMKCFSPPVIPPKVASVAITPSPGPLAPPTAPVRERPALPPKSSLVMVDDTAILQGSTSSSPPPLEARSDDPFERKPTTSPFVQRSRSNTSAAPVAPAVQATPSSGSNDTDEFALAPGDTDKQPLSPEEIRSVAKTLVRILTREIGCGAEVHEQRLTEHFQQSSGRCHRLAATFAATSETSYHPRARATIGLQAAGFPGPAGTPRACFPCASDLRALFEGRSSPQASPKQVCLHKETRTTDFTPLQQFDVDSVLVFPKSIRAFRRGFRYLPTKSLTDMVRSDIHIRKRVCFPDGEGGTRSETRDLRNIPHFPLGLLDGFRQATVFIFFPRLCQTVGERFTFVADDVFRRFTNHVFLPACRSASDPTTDQYFPSTQEQAARNAMASSAEQRRQGPIFRQASTYHIPPEMLETVDGQMQQRLAQDDGLDEFREAFLFVSVKGVKLEFKRDTLYEAMNRFDTHLEAVFHADGIDTIYRDVGREIAPPKEDVGGGDSDGDSDETSGEESGEESVGDGPEATVFLWKTCCLHAMLDRLQNCFGQFKGTRRFYHVGLLRDTACLSFTPPLTSKAFRAGLAYGQCYASVKTTLDAQSTYPFSAPHLSELAIDPKIWQAYAADSRVSHARDRAAIVGAYATSKARVRGNLEDCRHKSYGVRLELRLGSQLWKAVKQRAQANQADHQPPMAVPSSLSSSVWPVSTRNYVAFMLGNYDKFTSLLEMVSMSSPEAGIPHERTKLMLTVIKCIQCFANAHLAREKALWDGEADPDAERARYGLGFKDSILRDGYGWFASIVDWDALHFREEIADQVVVADRHILRLFPQSARFSQDLAVKIDTCCAALQDPFTSPELVDFVLDAVAHYCCMAFRRHYVDILQGRGELCDTVVGEGDKDSIRFDHDAIHKAFFDKPQLVSGNQTRAKQPADLYEWLWGHSAAYRRDHFAFTTFRALHSRALELMPEGDRSRYRTVHYRVFFLFHTIIPYPDGNGSLIAKDKKKRRLWYAVRPARPGEWKWAREKYHKHPTPSRPAAVTMTPSQLRDHITRLQSSKPSSRTVRVPAKRPISDEVFDISDIEAQIQGRGPLP